MPLSDEALTGVQAAVAWNPHGARDLLAILKEFPAWMKYKDDPYGPLSLMLFGGVLRKWIADGISGPVKPDPFPEDKLAACQTFGDEWSQRKFPKQGLAGRIEESR